MTEIFVPDTISFETAEKLVAVAIQMRYPSIILVGKNGIGKTWMLDTWQKKSPQSLAISDVDTGAFRSFQLTDYLMEEKIKTMFVYDFMGILSRKSEIRASAFSSMSETMDFERSHSIGYQTIKQKGWKNYINANTPRLNYIVASDFIAMDLCKSSSYSWNFLNRCIIFFIERSRYEPKFRCKFDTGKIEISDYPIEQLELRQQDMFNHVCTGLEALKHDGLVPMYFWDVQSGKHAGFSDAYYYYCKEGKITYGIKEDS